MNTVQNAIGFVTLLATFFASYKVWIVFCIAAIGLCFYKAFVESYSPSKDKWVKPFFVVLFIALVSNIYFWYDTKSELEAGKNQNSSQFPR
jgi:energy-coupling factor transporter transmembrane protein EcfT